MFIFKVALAADTAASVFLLGTMAGQGEVGYFNAADRLSTAIVGLFTPATQALMPYLFRRTAEEGHDAMFLVSRHILIVLVLTGFLFMIGTRLSATPLILVIAGSQYAPSIHVLQVLAFTFPLVAMNQALGFYVLLPLRLDFNFLAGSILADCINVGLTYLLAPTFGALGLAFSRLAGGTVTMITFSVILFKKGYLKKLLRRGPISQMGSA